MRLILDRINKNEKGKRIFAFEADSGIVFVYEDDMPMSFVDQLFENAIIECEYSDGKIINPNILLEETKRQEEKMKNRFANLINKRKKQ